MGDEILTREDIEDEEKLVELLRGKSPAERAAIHERVQQLLEEGEEAGVVHTGGKPEGVAKREIVTILVCPKCGCQGWYVEMSNKRVTGFRCLNEACQVRMSGHDDGKGPEDGTG